jgi:hypothetical protein
MKKTIAKTSIIIVIICLVIFPSYMCFKATKLLEKNKISNQIINSNFKIFQDVINESLSKTILADQRMFFPEHFYKYGIQKIDSINVESFINKIILVIPELSCNTCYDDVYEFIRYAKDSLSIDIPILTTKNRYREIVNILSDNLIQTDLYYTNENHFFEDNDNIEFSPYFVFMNQYGICNHLFIPQANHLYLTETYLISMKQRYKSILH